MVFGDLLKSTSLALYFLNILNEFKDVFLLFIWLWLILLRLITTEYLFHVYFRFFVFLTLTGHPSVS